MTELIFNLLRRQSMNRMKQMKYLIMDVDGTLTDGKIYMGNEGEMIKAFNVKDGCGIHDIAIPNGMIPIIITGRTSKILDNRCKELGITMLYQGVVNKIEKLKEVTNQIELIAYIGDDINDLSCMRLIKEAGGVVGCPNDAVEKVKEIADFISTYKGGEGAVREFIDWLVAGKV